MPTKAPDRQEVRRAPHLSNKQYSKARVRLLMVSWTTIMILLTLSTYLCAQDIRVLEGGILIHLAILCFFFFYFREKLKR